MDADFIYDTSTKRHTIETQGEYLAIAHFLNSEIAPSRHEVTILNNLIEQLESQMERLQYSEWTLISEGEEISLIHNSCFDDVDEREKEAALDLSLMSWELTLNCGRDDLLGLLHSWLLFIEES